jgi:hypothetical protein
MKASDGKSYKFERKQLSARTIADLALPSENSPTNANQTSPKVEAPEKTKELEETIAALRSQNAALREQARRSAPGATPVMSPPSSTAKVTYRVAGLPKNTPFLNVREGPGSDYPIVGTLSPDARGITFGAKRVTNGWTVWQEISGGGYDGWVNVQYLVAEAPTP